MNIFTFEISLPYDSSDPPWIKVIEVKENFTLKQLHVYIQDIVEFDNDHLYEFYLGKNHEDRRTVLPKSKKLTEVFPAVGLKLYYLFDFGDSWLFQIKQLRNPQTEDLTVKYPRVVKSIGINPEQYPEYEE